jgi:hypothetical protein
VYCEVCDHPVAKHNFTTRHKHLDVFKPSAETGMGKEKKPGNKKRTIREITEQEHEDKSDGELLHVSDPSSKYAKKPQQMPNDEVEQTRPSKLQKVMSNTPSSWGAMSHSIITFQQSRKEEGRPAQQQSIQRISRSNPKSGSVVESSVDNVRTGSLSTNHQNDMPGVGHFNNLKSDAPSSSCDSSSQGDSSVEEEWIALLKERPASKKSEKMTTWLRNVIFTSEHVVASRKSTTEDDSPQNPSPEDSASTTEEDGNSNSAFSDLVVEGEGMNFARNIHSELSNGAHLLAARLEPPTQSVSRNKTKSSSDDDGISDKIGASETPPPQDL